MKYDPIDDVIAKDQRAEINHRIVNLILAGHARQLEPRVVFHQFTGKGALHGLSLKDFPSFHAYSEAKKEIELGQFFTPPSLCEQIIKTLEPPPSFKIADITCGKGSFFNYLPAESNCYGNELDRDAFEICKYLFPQSHLENKDFLDYDPKVLMDLIVGNPPFNIDTEEGSSQFAFVKKSHQLLAYDGILAFIVPLKFLSDQFQDGHKIQWINDRFKFILQAKLPPTSFDVKIDTKLIVLQKRGYAHSEKLYSPDQWTPFDPEALHKTLIRPVLDNYFAHRAKNKRLHGEDAARYFDIDYHINRRLWHVKENKKLYSKYYEKALKKLALLKTQQQPAGMPGEEWERQKMTPKKILAYLASAVRGQNARRSRKEIELVKTSYGVKYKAYHPSLLKQQSKLHIHDILAGNYDLGKFNRLFARKKATLQLHKTYFTELGRSELVDQFLDEVKLEAPPKPGLLFQPDDVPVIRPNAMQRHDLGLVLQKSYGILAWEQGGGKSVAGMIWIKYHQKRVKHCYIVGPAIAITGTWEVRLAQYGFDYITLRTISDLDKIQKGQLILVSNDMLIELERHIKRHVRRCSQKIALLVDESDELTNPHSQRTTATLNCFRRVKFKLLTTGTTTRNSINEIYSQLELLYNNSTAFLCDAKIAYYSDESGDLREKLNPYWNKPFPPHTGNAVFQSCFCPMKSTVFGIRKDNQDVFNEPVLKDIINRSVITRKFEEIVGEKKHTVHMHQVVQQSAERTLYGLLMKDFMKVCYDYYTSTGNSRKEAGLRLVRQMKVLISATSLPHTMANYVGGELPAKFQYIRDLVAKWPSELVTIGTTLKKAAHLYLLYLAKAFPNRKLFYIDGELSVPARQKVLAQLKNSRNGILVATQQSLKSSVNIPFCNKAIIESLQWNIPKMSQFYFRFIRFDSVRHTQVHFVNYTGTIEINLMALLMAKERLNDFIKTTNQSSTAKIYEEYGFDLGILDSLITKTYDDDGNLHLVWGQQRIAA